MKTQVPRIDAAEATQQAERMIASRTFANAKRSQRLLLYLVDAAITDPPQAIKEYTLATEVFDRDDSYDPAVDATVRVEAGRLRTRLREYYGDEGREDALLIELPKGGYRVVLTSRGAVGERTAGQEEANPSSVMPLDAERPQWSSSALELESGNKDRSTIPAGDGVRVASASDHHPPQEKLARGPMLARVIWRYALPLMTAAILLGIAALKYANQQHPHPGLRSVAVLPLKNLSADPAQDYFADGTTDELITELARVPELRVVSWNSVLQEKDTKKPLKTIATELRADLLVEGSVSRSGDTVRINAQLIDAKNDNHLWADSLEGPMSEVMALESKAAEGIVDHARLSGRSLLPSGESGGAFSTSTPINPAAHEAYLRGKYYFDKRQAEMSAEQFQRAVDLSPRYASAYAGLAAAIQAKAMLGVARPEQVIPEAMAAVEKALELDPNNGDALIARGSMETAFLWKWKEAERDLTRGIALSPNNSFGRMMFSVYLDSVGRTGDAVKQMQDAVEIDPLSFFMARHLGSTFYYARRYDEALRQLLYAREMYPASAATVDHWISSVYAKKGMYDEAVHYDLLGQKDVHSRWDPNKQLAAYRRKGWQGYWLARMEEFQEESPDPLYNFDAGIAAMRAGRHDMAITALKRATDEHCYWMGVALIDPDLDELRRDPGFSDILTELHLPPAAKASGGTNGLAAAAGRQAAYPTP